MLEAKCHKCDNKAYVNEEMNSVKCDNCNTTISYDDYIEIMKKRALNMGIEFQYNNDKNPF